MVCYQYLIFKRNWWKGSILKLKYSRYGMIKYKKDDMKKLQVVIIKFWKNKFV